MPAFNHRAEPVAVHGPSGTATAPRPATPAGQGGPPSPAAQPGMGLQSAEIVLRHEGQRVASVHADRVALSPDMRYAVLSPQVEGQVYEDGRVSLLVRCDEMVIDRETNDLVMRGRIEVRTSNGDQVAAPEARWDGRRQQLTFPGGLRLATRDSTVSARHASAPAGLRVLDLADDVVVTFPIKEPLP
jgi:hypothetical protein